MPTSECYNCGNDYFWLWEEAFDKFGFKDGDGMVMTHVVEDALRSEGYAATSQEWGMHNTIITSIRKNDIEQIPPFVNLGYDEPRHYLPPEIICLLDNTWRAK